MRRNKYHNTKTVVDGITFDSKKEAQRYQELLQMVAKGEICDLHRQVGFELIPAQREPDSIGKRGGIIKGKTIEKAVNYYADFCYITRDGEYVVEDVKGGVLTPEYKIKRKLMLLKYGIQIKQV